MPDPTTESFFASKTMILLCIGIGAIVLLVTIGIVIKVIWKIDAFQLISSGILGISAHSGAGTVRNVQVDGSVRQAQAGVIPTTVPAVPGPLNAPPVAPS